MYTRNPQLPDANPARRFARIVAQQNYPPRTARPTLICEQDIPNDAPLDAGQIAQIGASKYGTFTIGATALDEQSLDLTGYTNLSSALGTAYVGGYLLWQAERSTGTSRRGGGGLAVVRCNYHNGSGRGTFPYCWTADLINQGDPAAGGGSSLGVTVRASIVTDDLVVYMVNRDGIGGTVLGEFWWTPFSAQQATV